MSDNVLNFVRCQWCTSGNAADMGHWGKCPGAAERDKAAEARVAEMFAALNAPTESATADQLRRKLLECEEALRTTEACAEKAERERDALRSILAELADEAVIVPRFASVREVHTLMARSLDGDRLPVLDLTAAQVEALGLGGADTGEWLV